MQADRQTVVITGSGVICSLADSPAALEAALLAGTSGLRPIELFPLDGLPALPAGAVRPFDAQEYLGTERNLRPIDRTSRLLLIASDQALAAAGWTAELRRAHEVGLALGTTFCSVRTIAEFDRRGQKLGPAYVSPLDFANSVINAAAGQTAIWHDLRGPNTTVSCGEASGLAALAYAAEELATARAAAVLAGGAEELCLESFLGYCRAGRLAGSDGAEPRAVPFDAERNGFAQAEGAAMLLLEGLETARERGAAILGVVRGWGSAFAPAREEAARAAAVARAIETALGDAGLEPAAIAAVWCGANGSPVGDRAEARGLAAALGDHAGDVPVVAIKSMVGESLGASGALQAIAALRSLASGQLPAIAGLSDPEADLGLGGLVLANGPLRGDHLLLTALAHDGQAVALVIGREDHG